MDRRLHITLLLLANFLIFFFTPKLHSVPLNVSVGFFDCMTFVNITGARVGTCSSPTGDDVKHRTSLITLLETQVLTGKHVG